MPLYETVLGAVMGRDEEWFNVDEKLKEGLVSVIDSKDSAVQHAVVEWAREIKPQDKVGIP